MCLYAMSNLQALKYTQVVHTILSMPMIRFKTHLVITAPHPAPVAQPKTLSPSGNAITQFLSETARRISMRDVFVTMKPPEGLKIKSNK